MCPSNKNTDDDYKENYHQTKEEKENASKKPSLRWPEEKDDDTGSFFLIRIFKFIIRQWKVWTFAYMNGLLKQGEIRHRHQRQRQKRKGETGKEEKIPNCLTVNDLFRVPKTMKSNELVQEFRSYYDDNSGRSSSNKEEEEGTNNTVLTTKELIYLFWKLSRRTYIPAGLCELLVVICQTLAPLMVRELLRILEKEEEDFAGGIGYGIGIFIVFIINTFGNNRHRHLALQTGIVLRSSIINIIYQHILYLSPEGKIWMMEDQQSTSSESDVDNDTVTVTTASPGGGLTSGEVTNLIAVDAQKLYEVTQDGHLIWALPLSIITITYFLVQTMGPSTLVGIFTLIAFVPIVKSIIKIMLRIRSKRTFFSDRRINVVTDMLRGIRTTKLNGYESKYLARIRAIRNDELKELGHEQAIWATTLLITVTSPVIATGATFATYILINSEPGPDQNILTASNTFGVLLFFGALRFPINFGGRLIGKAAQALSALQRIVAFLNRPQRQQQQQQQQHCYENNNDSHAVSSNTKTNDIADNSLIPSLSSSRKYVPPSLTVSNATFRIGGTTSKQEKALDSSTSNYGNGDNNGGFTVSGLNFQIHRGEVLAVCGPVGSGKSTLLNGILEEAEALDGTQVAINGITTINNTNGKQRKQESKDIISYVAQTPFILNRTLRDNILFGLPMNWNNYQRVLHACALSNLKVELGDDGDMTEIGERGVTLSGGQKQRVSLARAAYASVFGNNTGLVVLDDPFSALDSDTSHIVFDRLLGGGAGALWHDKAVLFVTHAPNLIVHRSVTNILVLVHGQTKFYGNREQLCNYSPPDDDGIETKRAIDHIQSNIQEGQENDAPVDVSWRDNEGSNMKSSKSGDITTTKNSNCDGEGISIANGTTEEKDKSKVGSSKKLVQAEEREHGLSNISTWLLWFHRAGGVTFIFFQVLFMTIDRAMYVGVEYILARWTSAAYGPITMFGYFELPPQTDGLSAQSQYLMWYWIAIPISFLATFVRSEWAVTGGNRATRRVFDSMLESVLRAPMSYFETVPMGRILNRFTYDTDVTDITLTQVISMFMISISWFVAGVAVMCSILPWSAFAIVPVSVMYWYLLLHYRKSGPDLQRLDALSRSPLQSMTSECFEGSTTIRVYRQDTNFVRSFYDAADTNSSALLNFVTAQRWLGIRIEILGAIVVLASTVIVVCFKETLNIEPGLVGLLINWATNFTITLNFLVDTFSETEAAITAIERVDAMAELPSEASVETIVRPEHYHDEWPESGHLSFDNVSLRYREGLPLALNQLSFVLKGGMTCGIVGPSGAGKSSIAVALFRLVEIESGTIRLDGVDLSQVGLSDVRGGSSNNNNSHKNMAIIPQDPFLAGQTLRECLDPFQEYTDDQIMDALGAVRFFSKTQNTNSASPIMHDSNDSYEIKAEDDTSEATSLLLSTPVDEGGSNYSVGERQLLNLARALLSKPKVLLLDEATASIDGETDAFIQTMLRSRFAESNTTVITIAHRLHTIMDYDVVLVMEDGKAAEFGKPHELLSNKNGLFSKLVDATGSSNSQLLRKLAKEAAVAK